MLMVLLIIWISLIVHQHSWSGEISIKFVNKKHQIYGWTKLLQYNEEINADYHPQHMDRKCSRRFYCIITCIPERGHSPVGLTTSFLRAQPTWRVTYKFCSQSFNFYRQMRSDWVTHRWKASPEIFVANKNGRIE